MLAMPGSRSYNKSVAPFQSVCLLFCHKHNIFHFFFSLTPRGVARHLMQPLPASLLLNQPKCLKQMLNYQLAFKKTLSLELTCWLHFPRNNIIFPICTVVIKQRKWQHVYNIKLEKVDESQNKVILKLSHWISEINPIDHSICRGIKQFKTECFTIKI